MTSSARIAYTKIARKVIAAGAKWLDKQEPGWAMPIRLGIFDIGSPNYCVLGQVFHDKADGAYDDGYTYGITAFARTLDHTTIPTTSITLRSAFEVVPCGYEIGDHLPWPQRKSITNELWLDQIRHRKEAAKRRAAKKGRTHDRN